MQRSLPIPSASRASPRNRRHYPPQLGSTHRKRSQHRPQSNRSLANLMTPGVSKSLTRSEWRGIALAGCQTRLQSSRGSIKTRECAMTLVRRQVLRMVAGAVALPLALRLAQAQAYPSRPVRIIVGFPAGGPVDIAARVIAPWLTERLGQRFVVENQPGESGNMATRAVVKAAADGDTPLLFG